MATLYVRDCPQRLYKRLRARARRNGRSLNAEVLHLLETSADEDARRGDVVERLRALVAANPLPPGATDSVTLIREMRDAPYRDL